MDRKLMETLEACIQAIESGENDLDGCLRRYPEQAQQLRPQLQLLLRMDGNQKAERRPQALKRGQEAVLAELSAMNAGKDERMFGILTPALARAAAVVAAGFLLVGAAGASAGLGGPDPGGQVLDSVGIVGGDDCGTEDTAFPEATLGTPSAVGSSDDDECDHDDGEANDSDDGAADDIDNGDADDADDGAVDDADDGDVEDVDDADTNDVDDGGIGDVDDGPLGDGAADDLDDGAADSPEEDSGNSSTDGS